MFRFACVFACLLLFGFESDAFAQRAVVRNGPFGGQVIRTNAGIGFGGNGNASAAAVSNSGVSVRSSGHCGSSAAVFSSGVPVQQVFSVHAAPFQLQQVQLQSVPFGGFALQSYGPGIPQGFAVQNFNGFGGVTLFQAPVPSSSVLIQSNGGCGHLFVR